MPKHLFSLLSLIAAIVLLLMLNFTTPVGVGPLGVLVFFTTFYVFVLGIVVFLVKLFVWMLGRKMGRRDYLCAAIISFAPVMLSLMRSVGAMSFWTVGVMVVCVALWCFLINRR